MGKISVVASCLWFCPVFVVESNKILSIKEVLLEDGGSFFRIVSLIIFSVFGRCSFSTVRS